MKTIVYIDGFNFYYGALKRTPYKWLNPQQLCQKLLPSFDVVKIKYYTAKVSARPADNGQPVRQQTYLRALKTVPNLEIIYGQFLQSKVRMRLADPPASGSKFIEVLKTEEKGSDVNMATHIVHDGHLDLYDAAVIVSNDSDLAEPVRIARHELDKMVGMLSPHKCASHALKKNVSFIKPIRKGVLRSSQFPAVLQDTAGTFRRPKQW